MSPLKVPVSIPSTERSDSESKCGLGATVAGKFSETPIKRVVVRDLLDDVERLCKGLGYSVTEVEAFILSAEGDYETILKVTLCSMVRFFGTQRSVEKFTRIDRGYMALSRRTSLGLW